MPLKPHTPSPQKAPEAVVSRMLAKLLGAQPYETVDEVVMDFREQLDDSPAQELMRCVEGIYPWNCKVADEIMSSATTPLVEHLISRPGQGFIVRSMEHHGVDSLWLAVADPPADVDSAIGGLACRGLFHTFRVEEEFSRVIAIQLSSCQL